MSGGLRSEPLAVLNQNDWRFSLEYAITLQAVYQGVVIAFLGAGLYSYAVQKIGASEASLMLALVPAVSAVGGLLILGEQLGTVAVLGIVVVSIGAVLGSLPPGKLKFGRWFKAQ